MSTAEPAALPPPPEGVIQATLADESGAVALSFRLEWCRSGKGIDSPEDLNAHQDPLSTALEPKLTRRSGSETCLWTAYRVSAHEEAGDTLVTYALVLETKGGSAHGIWYEDHEEVPRVFQRVSGQAAGARVELSLEESETGAAATLSGLIRRGS